MLEWERPTIIPRRITAIAQRLRSSSTDLVSSLSRPSSPCSDSKPQAFASNDMNNIDNITSMLLAEDLHVHVGLKFGTLHKCSCRIKRWTQALFVLEWKELTYYSDEQAGTPKVISLKNQCSVIEADINETKRPFSFKIAVQRRTFVLAAESRASMEEWIYALRSISGLYQPPPTVSSSPTPLEQANQLLQAVENILADCSRLISQASNTQVPGVWDQTKLIIITSAAIKCAASARVVAFRPNVQSALQQLASSLTEIKDHSMKYSEFLKVVIAMSKKPELDSLFKITESLSLASNKLIDRCIEPEPLTEQENVLLASRSATTAASSVFATCREKDVSRLVEASKSLVNNVNCLYETTRTIMEKTGHEQPKALAYKTLLLSRDLIAKSKAFHISERKDDETQASTAVVKLQEQIAAVVGAAQSAGQHIILEQQLMEAVSTIQNAANEMQDACTRADNKSGINSLGEFTDDDTPQATNNVIEAARALFEAIGTLPNAIKQCSKTTLFKVAKVIGTTTTNMVQAAAEFSFSYPGHDPNFLSHLSQTIRNMQSSGLQLLSIAKVVIQEEFKNQSDLLQLSGMARSHALCVSNILGELQTQFTLQPTKPIPLIERPSSALSNSSSSSGSSDFLDMSEFSTIPLSSRDSSLFGSHRDSTKSGGGMSPHDKKEAPRASNRLLLLQMVLDEPNHHSHHHSRHDEDVNIWNEPPDSGDNLITGIGDDGENYIRAATLNKLIIKLTNENDHDIKFQKTFIITYRSFTTPTKLLKKLMQRYHVLIPKLPPAITLSEYRKKSVLPIQLRVINVLKMWIENAFYDMNDDLIRKVRHFTENVLVMDGHNTLATQINSTLDKQIKARHSCDHPQFEPCAPQADKTPAKGLEEHSDEEIAQQLTIVDFELYTTIKPVELLNQAWNKESLKHRAPNVLAMISRFNSISTWAAAIILWKQTIKERVALWVKLVSVTEQLLKLNNFNTALAIISGLNSAATYRLKYTRAELPKKTQTQFESAMQLMNSEQAYKAYRDVLHNANPPCVPYLGVYLTDLTFIEDGNKDFIQNLINFRKRQLVSEVVSEIQLYQQFPYDLPRNESLLSLFHHLPSSTEDQLYQISLLREPRSAERIDIL